MRIYKTVLYPFSIHAAYFGGYAWSVELALRLNASLQLFSTMEADDETAGDTFYQSLLAAHGHYLHHFHHDKATQPHLVREQYLVKGEFREVLINHLRNNAVDILVIDKTMQTQLGDTLKDVVQESKSAIILSQLPELKPDIPITEHFYSQLRKAEFYKVPAHFYSSLHHDNKAFNYLRSLFQKSPG